METAFAATIGLVAVLCVFAIVVWSLLMLPAPRPPPVLAGSTRDRWVTPSWLAAVGDACTGADLCDAEVVGMEHARQRLIDELEGALTTPTHSSYYHSSRSAAVLLHGPRGCGKTLLASTTVAGTFAAVVVRVSARDLMAHERVPPQQMMTALVRYAQHCAPSALLIDDLQHLFPGSAQGQRSAAFDLLQEVRRRSRRVPFVIIGMLTTLHDEDPAVAQLLRGFDTAIAVGLPDRHTRQGLIEDIAARRAVRVSDVAQLVELTYGMSGAQVIEAADRACGRAVLIDGPAACLTPTELSLALELPTPPRWIDEFELSRSARPAVDALLTQLLDPVTSIGVVVFGDRGVGRRTLVDCLARTSGRAVVTITSIDWSDDGTIGPVAAARFNDAIDRRPSIVLLEGCDGTDSDGSDDVAAGVGEALDQVLAVPGVSVVAIVGEVRAVHPVLRRPGRLAERVFVSRPDEAARVALLSRHLRTAVLQDVSIEVLATELAGYTSGDVAELVRRAINRARRRDPASRRSGVTVVTARDLWDARQERIGFAS